jgi:hypothetical protein
MRARLAAMTVAGCRAVAACGLALTMLGSGHAFADVAGTLSLSDTSQATIASALQHSGAEVDLETLPFASLTLGWSEQSLSLGYGPRLMLRDVFRDRAEIVLHVARARYSLATQSSLLAISAEGTFGNESRTTYALAPPLVDTMTTAELQRSTERQALSSQNASISYAYTGSRFRLVLSENAGITRRSVAELSFGANASTPSMSGTPLPATPTTPATSGASPAPVSGQAGVGGSGALDVASETSLASATYAWTARVQSTMSASYTLVGGWGDAQQTLPLQRTAIGELAVSDAVSARDELVTRASVTEGEIDGQPGVSIDHNYWIARASEGWNRNWGTVITTALEGGAAYVIASATTVDGERENRVVPYGVGRLNAALYEGEVFRLGAHVGAGVGPMAIPLSGTLEVLVQADAGINADWRFAHTTVGALAAARESVSLDSSDRARILAVGLGAGQEVGQFFFVALRSGSSWQTSEIGSLETTTHAWFATLALTVRAPDIRF